MLTKLKYLFVACALLVLITSFQNCVVQQDDEGNIVMQEELPKKFDKITLSSEFDQQVQRRLELDLQALQVRFSMTYYNPSTREMDVCQKDQAMDETVKTEILKAYSDSKICRSYQNADPETVCTLQILPDEMFRVYSDSQIVLNEKMGISPCKSGSFSEFCQEPGDEFKLLLENLQKSLQDQCNR